MVVPSSECHTIFFQVQSVIIMVNPVDTVHLLLKPFLKTGKSVIATQRVFPGCFMLHWNDLVPDRNLILSWVENSFWKSIIPM